MRECRHAASHERTPHEERTVSRTRQPLSDRERQWLMHAKARVAAAEILVRRERESLAQLVAALLDGGASHRAIADVLGRAPSYVHKLGQQRRTHES
jgi:hypothetical protein